MASTSRGTCEHGSALVVVLLLLMLALILLAAVTSRVAADTQAHARRWKRVHAFNAAEAGLAEAVQHVLHQQSPRVPVTTMGPARYSVRPTWLGIDHRGFDQVQLVAEGTCRDVTEQITATIAEKRDPSGNRPPVIELRAWDRRAR